MDLRKSIRCQTDVALNITKHLFSKKEYQERNLIFSPFSLYTVLSVMAAGSEGSTLDELLSFLQSDSVDHLNTFFSQLVSAVLSDSDVAAPSHHLSFANGMWAHKLLDLSQSFKQLVATHYKATLASVDFRKPDKVRHEVNSWVEKETNGLISELLAPNTIGKRSRLVFANALHFKGAWKQKFDDSSTFDYNFHLLNGNSVRVPFMTSKKNEQFISICDGFKVLRLSYKQGIDRTRRFSMYIFLPDEKDGLSALIEKLATESDFLKGKLPRRKVRVGKFRIPKFKISFALETSKVLKEMGVVLPFSRRANFTKMVDSSYVYVDRMFHKASIEVNEEGTEVTAANSMNVAILCDVGGGTGINFVADHPFLFLIREDLTGTILFLGQMLNPLDRATTPVKNSLEDYMKMLKRKSDSEPEENEDEEDEGDHDENDKLEVPPKKRSRED
ncbi:hypothetical protein OROMI_015363 [Orobanche minor]